LFRCLKRKRRKHQRRKEKRKRFLQLSLLGGSSASDQTASLEPNVARLLRRLPLLLDPLKADLIPTSPLHRRKTFQPGLLGDPTRSSCRHLEWLLDLYRQVKEPLGVLVCSVLPRLLRVRGECYAPLLCYLEVVF